MLKKMTTIFLLMSFTQVYAVTPVQESISRATELNRAFDELNYRINVEWNQTDSSYVKSVLVDFEQEIANLQHDGLSNKDIMDYTISKIKDKSIKDEVNSISSVIKDNQMSQNEAREFALSKINNFYSHGANWSGGKMHASKAALIIGIIAIIYCCTTMHSKDGKDGTNGIDGTNGTNGTNGTDGKDGMNGKNGKDGKDGTNGTNGTNGSGCPVGYSYQLNGNNGTAICHVNN